MGKHMTEADFEAMVTRIFRAKDGKFSRDEIRKAAREIAAKDGITIGEPIREKVEHAQVRAAEDVVLSNMRNESGSGSLLQQIQTAQVRAGEDAVIASLRSKGLSLE